MKKRAIISFIALLFVYSTVAVRMGFIISSATETASSAKSEKSMELYTVKGQIWDCNLKPLVDTVPQYYAAILPEDDGIDFVNKHYSAEVANALKERLNNGKPVCEPVPTYAKSNNAVTMISLTQRYADNQLAAHIIGYTDSYGNGISGIEKAFQSIINESSYSVSAKFSINGRGQAMNGSGITVINENKAQNSGVILTIDRTIQQIAENVMDENKINCGAVIISDVNTGEIKAAVSRPVYNPNEPAASLSDENGPFLNRALQSYAVGSVFKPVIAAAALEYGILPTQAYSCEGLMNVNGVTFHCHKDEGHSTIDMKSAVAESCNLYFIQLSQKLPRDVILEKAKAFGFGTKTELADGIISKAGNLPTADELDSDAAKANLSFGQGSLLATPLQINAMTACIANGGIYYTPQLILGTRDEKGRISYYPKSQSHRAIQESTAEMLQSCLHTVIKTGTGKRAASDLFESAGKTATAQTGHYDENGEQHNAWFTGYFPYEAPKYAVTVFIEDGGEGALSAAPLFKQISESIMVVESTQ